MRFILTLLFFIIASSVSAHDYRVTNVYNSSIDSGIALGIANAQLDFDWSTLNQVQAGVGMGTYNGKSALAFGASKRVGSILLKASAGLEDNKQSLGFGIMVRF